MSKYDIKATPKGIELRIYDDFISSPTKKLVDFEIFFSIEELQEYIKLLNI